MKNKTGVLVKQIMDRNFPIIDVSVPLIRCVKRMSNKHEACIVVKNGYFYGVLGFNEILRGFMFGKDKDATIEEVKIRKNFAIVNPGSDVYKTLLLMRKNNTDFILVKQGKDFLGIISKKEIVDIEPESEIL